MQGASHVSSLQFFPIVSTLLPQFFPNFTSTKRLLRYLNLKQPNYAMASKQAQEVIDAQMANLDASCPDLQKQIQVLKIRRNSYALISQLPDDVLLEIFALVMTIFPEANWYREVTHVCRRWRHIAVEAATLWTNPPLLQHDFAMLMLERSKSADLTILLTYELPYKTIKNVVDCIGRIEKLEISLKMDMLDSMCSLMATGRRHASRLRRLILHCLSKRVWDSRPMFGLSTAVFCQLHLLRELDIANIIFDWNILPLPNLVLLRFIKIFLPGQISMQQLLDTLRRMPRLETLQIPISRSLFSLPSSTTATTSGAQVMLPRLSHLDLSDSNLAHVQWFVPRLTLPQLRRMVMLPSPKDYHSANDSSHIAHTIASLITNGDFGSFETLNLYRNRFELSMLGRQCDDNPHMHFSMRNRSRNANPEFTQASLDIFSLSRANLWCLVELKIDELSMTADEMFQLSTSLYLLRKIELFRATSTVSALIEVLAMLPPYHPIQSDAEIPFPALESIMFSVINFASNPAILEALCDCLMLRSEYGIAIQGLSLFECWVFFRQFSLLEEIVVDVDCSTTIRW